MCVCVCVCVCLSVCLSVASLSLSVCHPPRAQSQPDVSTSIPHPLSTTHHVVFLVKDVESEEQPGDERVRCRVRLQRPVACRHGVTDRACSRHRSQHPRLQLIRRVCLQPQCVCVCVCECVSECVCVCVSKRGVTSVRNGAHAVLVVHLHTHTRTHAHTHTRTHAHAHILPPPPSP